MSILEVKNMSTLERIQAMELLWDALSHDDNQLDSPEWHEDILKKRKEKIESGKAEFITLDQLKNIFCK